MVDFGPRAGHGDHRDLHRSLGIALVATLGKTGRRHGEGTAREGSDPLGHRGRHLAAHHAVLPDGGRRHAKHLLLHRDGVGGHGTQVVLRRPGHRGDEVGNLPAGAGLGGAERPAATLQQRRDPVLRRLSHFSSC